ncbi:hypothetical protein EJ02DRAFT_439217 [Clathrospora elynae]|uniref:Uncharacterized protein n=1 Tax=Clathrospora elynae TaxID=706981 RepID=A0A6A5S7S9_9PLEO|nr:hypothetical protein EJ02DRAFT_439217 [Clathrospora elynae]
MQNASTTPIAPIHNMLASVSNIPEDVDAWNEHACNAFDADTMGKPRTSPSTAAPKTVTYCSTGMQTMPPRNAAEFQKIYGREPTQQELSSKIGTAALGRFVEGPVMNPHEIIRGAPFPATRGCDDSESYLDAGFQTAEFVQCKQSLARAKVKAVMMVNKYRGVAEEACYMVWAESKVEKVIHSEQFAVKIELDKDGNATTTGLDGIFLPNIYGEEINPALASPLRTFQERKDDLPKCLRFTGQTESHVYSPTSGLTPPATPTFPPFQRIAALAPSLRESDPDPEPIEDYGYTPDESDEVADKFVIYEAPLSTPSTPTLSSIASPCPSQKRKVSSLTEDSDGRYPTKRVKASYPCDMADPIREGDDIRGVRRRRDGVIDENTLRCDEEHDSTGGDREATEENARRRERSTSVRNEDASRAPRRDRNRDAGLRSKDLRTSRVSKRRSRSPGARDDPSPYRSRGNARRDGENTREVDIRAHRDARETERGRKVSCRSESRHTIERKRELSPKRLGREKRETVKKAEARPRGRREDLQPYKPAAKEQHEAQMKAKRGEEAREMKRARGAEDRRRLEQDDKRRAREAEDCRRQEAEDARRAREVEDRRQLEREAEDVVNTKRRQRRERSADRKEKARQKTDAEAKKPNKPVDGFQLAREAENLRRELAHKENFSEKSRQSAPERSVHAVKRPANKESESSKLKEKTEEKNATGAVKPSVKKEDELPKPREKTGDKKGSEGRPRRAPREEIKRWVPRARRRET